MKDLRAAGLEEAERIVEAFKYSTTTRHLRLTKIAQAIRSRIKFTSQEATPMSDPRRRYYLAASFDNLAQVKRLDAFLVGHTCSHRWWEEEKFDPGLPWEVNADRLALAAARDLNGVASADAVIVLLGPASRQRGTHVELGAALLGATFVGGVRVILAGAAEPRLDPVAFYYHPQVVRVFDASEAILFQRLLQEVERS